MNTFFSGVGNFFSSSKGNQHVNLTGKENTGSVNNNLSSDMNCQNCKLDVTENLNCSVDLKNSTLLMKFCSQVNIKGNENQLDISEGSNVQFTGDGNNCVFNENSNLAFKGNNSSRCILKTNSSVYIYGNQNDIQASGNSKMEIKGNENVIKAVENTKLTVNGDFNNLIAISTNSHSFTPALLNSKINKLAISNKQTEFEGAEPSFHYFIEYVKEAQVIKQKHQVGIFKFYITEGQNYVDVNLDTSQLDDFNATQVQPDQSIIHGRKSSQEEQLRITGLRVKMGNDPLNLRVYVTEKDHL